MNKRKRVVRKKHHRKMKKMKLKRKLMREGKLGEGI